MTNRFLGLITCRLNKQITYNKCMQSDNKSQSGSNNLNSIPV